MPSSRKLSKFEFASSLLKVSAPTLSNNSFKRLEHAAIREHPKTSRMHHVHRMKTEKVGKMRSAQCRAADLRSASMSTASSLSGEEERVSAIFHSTNTLPRPFRDCTTFKNHPIFLQTDPK